MRIVGNELLHGLVEQARKAPRRRKNHNFHPADASRCQRLLNAIEPDSYIRPHRHLESEKDEAFILMQGRLGIVLFSPEGEVTATVVLARESGNLAVDIPHGVYHGAVSLESGTVFYEAKAGPYLPLTEAEKAPWAPVEEESGVAAAYLEKLRRLFASASEGATERGSGLVQS